MIILLSCALTVAAVFSVTAAIAVTVHAADWLEDKTGLLWPAIPVAFIIWVLELSLVATLFYIISVL